MSAPPPLLRAPPFPWVAAEVAAVSMPGAGAPAPVDDDALFRAIREARVGGAFWNPPAPPPDGAVALLAPTSGAQRAVMLEAVAKDAGRTPCEPVGLGPWSLLDGDVVVHADAGHEIAALALIAGTPVRLYGIGRFGRDGEVDRAAVLGALTAATVYRDPFTGAPIGIEGAIAQLADWRRLISANQAIGALAGIARWKRQEIERLFWAPRARPLQLVRTAAQAVAAARGTGGAIAAWPSREPPGLRAAAAAAGRPIAAVEDGFIRSVGLGSGLHPPLSIAVDRRGIYYDPTRPSDLEHLLETMEATPALLERAARLRDTLVAGGIAKYGRGGGAPVPPRAPGRRLVLVPGQVSDDLSVRLGGGADVRGNLDLLARVRAAEPEAEIWYRPHPDVDAGHRRGAMPDAAALAHADRVLRGQSMSDLLEAADAVHVLTSLTGFEALLRGRAVTTHGVPFFAGWGLTRDLAPIPSRRTRRLAIEELVAGALILYPRYLDPETHLPCPPEILVHRFLAQPVPRATALTRLRAWQGRAVRVLADLFGAGGR